MTDKPMNLFSPSGTKVLFLKLDGVPGQEFAAEHLTEGTIYTVESIEVHRFSSYVTLKEFPGLSFNTVLFFEESKDGSFVFGEAKIESRSTFTVAPADYTCPTCGWKCKSPQEGLAVSLNNTQGLYCLECFGKWIHANIPKMIEDKHE